MPRLPLLALLAVIAGSLAFHAYRAEHPTTSYQSADERSYGKLAVGIADAAHLRQRAQGPAALAAGRAVRCSPPGTRSRPDAASAETFDIPAAYWLQALVSLGTAAGGVRDRGAAGGRVGGRGGGRARRALPAADPRDGRADLRAAGRVLPHARVPALRARRAAGAGVAVRGRRGGAGRGGADPRRPAAGAVRARPARGAVDLAGGRRPAPRRSWSAARSSAARCSRSRPGASTRPSARGSSCRSRAGRPRRCSSAPTCRATARRSG